MRKWSVIYARLVIFWLSGMLEMLTQRRIVIPSNYMKTLVLTYQMEQQSCESMVQEVPRCLARVFGHEEA